MVKVGAVDEELIKSILRVLAKKGVYLTSVRSQKLFYLIERSCVQNEGRRCLWLDYRYDQFGMYSPTLNRIMRSLNPTKDHLQVRKAVYERGDCRQICCVGRKDVEEEPLPGHLERAIAEVLSEWMYLDTPTLVSLAKRTSPFVHAKKGEELDWNLLLEERCDKGKELSDGGKQKLNLALRQAQADRCKKFGKVDDVLCYLFS